MQELGILKLFTEKREEHDKYNVFFRQIQNLDTSLQMFSKLIDAYYQKYSDHEYIGQDEFKSFYDFKYQGHKDRAFHMSLIERMYALDVSTDVMEDLVEQAMEKYWAGVIVTSLMPVMEGKKSGILPKVAEHVDSFVSTMKNPPIERTGIDPIDIDVEDLIMGKVQMEGAQWQLETLNSVLGPAQPGTMGLVFAYVDGGKTSFALSALKSFAEWYAGTEDQLVYACNEESGKRVNERLASAFLGKSYWEIHEQFNGRWDECRELLGTMGYDNIQVIDGVVHIKQVRRILEEVRPKILMIDQGSKVTMDTSVDGVKATRLLYNQYRDMGNEYDSMVLALEQAIGAADNKQWLTLADVYESRVAIQGELDFAIGIGKILEQRGRENFRYINVSKNKLKDGQKAAFTTYFDPERCVWRAA